MRLRVSLALLLLAGNAMAQEPLPKLELGVGALAISIPDYRGSSDSSLYLVPIPYIKYRGDRVRVDDGAQGIFFESEDLAVSLSSNLALAGDTIPPNVRAWTISSHCSKSGPQLTTVSTDFDTAVCG